MAGIFISYRRTQEPSAFARLVSDRLGRAFPAASIFLDVAAIDAGHDWQAAIKNALAGAETLLALIDEKWLTAADEHGRRRLDLPDDYVCFEIASALSAGTRVIPVLIGKASMPIPAALPPSLTDLTKRQAMRLTHEGFDTEVVRLIETLGGTPTTAAKVPARPPQPPKLPHASNPYFTGRDEDLVQLHATLRATGKAVRVQVVVAAMGGVGKTTLANEYAHRHWRDYRQVLWVDARRGYEAEFALACDRLFPERATADMLPAAKAKAALAELNGATDRLLVIDNAEDDKSVQPWLPQGATGCRTLITSRFTAWPKATGVKVIDLDVLDPDAARDFLIERTGHTNEAEACAALAKELGYLPLALEQAGAYIDEVGVSVATYRRLLSEAAETVLGRPAPGSTQYSDPVLATWRTTIDELKPESRAILRLCAWYADTPIPTTLILEGADDVLALAAKFGEVAPRPESDAATEARLREAIAGLKRYSMILDVTNESFRLHGLVQRVERLQATKDGDASEVRKCALECLTAVFPYAFREASQWPLCRQLMPHQQALIDHLRADPVSLPLARLSDLIGSFLHGAGDAAGALPFLQRASNAREQLLGPEHEGTLSSINNLALCLKTLGDAEAALPLYQRVVDRCERQLGADHPGTLTNANNLATCLEDLGDRKAALALHQRILDARERVLGPDHPDTLQSLNNLAVCLRASGDAKAALPLYQRSLSRCERQLGPDHLYTLGSVNNLAACLSALGDTKAALPLYQRAADGAERVLGPEHPWTREFKRNLAACEEKLRDQSSAPTSPPADRTPPVPAPASRGGRRSRSRSPRRPAGRK